MNKYTQHFIKIDEAYPVYNVSHGLRTTCMLLDSAYRTLHNTAFLIGPVPGVVADKIKRFPKVNTRRTKDRKAGPMLNKTRNLLKKFYRAYNKDLSNILGEKRFFWS